MVDNMESVLQQLLTGEMCCFDLSAADQWKSGQAGWKKRCCNNPSGSPVIRPGGHFSHTQIKKVSCIVYRERVGVLPYSEFRWSFIIELLISSGSGVLTSCQYDRSRLVDGKDTP